MPELPEVETVRRGLAASMVGRRLASVDARRPDLRLPLPRDFAARLEGREVVSVERWAKYILVHLADGLTLLVHLGMTGRFTIFPPAGRARNLGEFYYEPAAADGAPGLHDHVLMTLDDGTRIVFTDPRRFGVMDLVRSADLKEHRLLKGLGVEPLSRQFTPGFLARILDARKAPLKSVLMDQRNIAGLGNIYACEALFRAGLSPERPARTLTRRGGTDRRLVRLASAVRQVLRDAIRAGGSTLRDYAAADGKRGGYQSRFKVYDRAGSPCLRTGCRGRVRRVVQAGRSTFYCPVCQR
jgi:formamidopyrimidine-DNA glycosylase